MLSAGLGAPNCSGLPAMRSTNALKAAATCVERKMLGGEPAESRESGVIGRHPGAQLGQDVALLSIRREHASGPEHREIAGDFERADRAARHENPLPAVALRILVGLRVDRAAFTAETGKPWNVRHEGLLVPAGGEHDMCECLPDRGDPPRRATQSSRDRSPAGCARRASPCAPAASGRASRRIGSSTRAHPGFWDRHEFQARAGSR